MMEKAFLTAEPYNPQFSLLGRPILEAVYAAPTGKGGKLQEIDGGPKLGNTAACAMVKSWD
jgi:hypothetical protein